MKKENVGKSASNSTKNCHYVQQAYLRLFASNDKRTHIWEFDKKTGNSERRKISKVAKEDYFYTQEVEDWLSKNVEVRGIKAIRKLIRFKDITQLSDNEKQQILQWVIIQNERTLERRDSLEEGTKKFTEKIIEKFNAPKSMVDELISANFIEEMQYSLMFNFQKLIPHLMQYQWILFENTTNCDLYTSDHVISMDNNLHRKLRKNLGILQRGGGYGYLSDGIEIHVPLTPNLSLALLNPNISTIPIKENGILNFKKIDPMIKNVYKNLIKETCSGVLALSEDNVIYQNHRTLNSANRYIYSCKDNFEFARKIMKENPEYKKGGGLRLSIT